MVRGGGGVRETFSLFVTLELGAEEKPTVEAIKREEGGGEQRERERWPSAQRITASLAVFGVNQGTILHRTSGSVRSGTSASLRSPESGQGTGDS